MKSHMRVVHLTSVHSAFDNRIFQRECRSLAANGYDTVLVAPHGKNEETDGVRIVAAPEASTENRWQRILRVVPSVYRYGKAEDAALYHFHDPELIFVGLLLQSQGKKVVYDVHEDYPSTIRHSEWLPSAFRRLFAYCFAHFERFASGRFSAVIGANPRITRRIAAYNPRSLHIGNYPALEEYPSKPSFDENRYSAGKLVSFGGVCARTCSGQIVQALEHLPTSSTAKRFLGGRIFSQTLARELSATAGWNRVTFLGEIPANAMLAQLLGSSVALVLFSPEPNHFGVGSNRLFEALAAGLPVITSDFPEWRSMIERIGCGLCVDPADTRSIAEAISYLMSHTEEAAQMGRRGYEAACSEFNWERESDRLISLYDSLLTLPCHDATSMDAEASCTLHDQHSYEART
jgi:glycosyltransferase involved in cell wall biosynthesis